MNENTAPSCACSSAPSLIFACSGAADVGEIADRTARRLTKEKAGKMYCLAGIGGRVEEIMVNAQAAEKILAIDGCEKDCARLTLESAGFAGVVHLRLSDLGFEKKSSPPTGERLGAAAERGRQLLVGQ